MSRFQFTDEQWDKLVSSGYDLLAASAAEPDRFVYYADFCRHVSDAAGAELELGDHALPFVLGEVSTRSRDERGVMLTALVISGVDKRPGSGLFQLAHELTLMRAGDDPETFWIRQLEEVRRTYAPSM